MKSQNYGSGGRAREDDRAGGGVGDRNIAGGGLKHGGSIQLDIASAEAGGQRILVVPASQVGGSFRCRYGDRRSRLRGIDPDRRSFWGRLGRESIENNDLAWGARGVFAGRAVLHLQPG